MNRREVVERFFFSYRGVLPVVVDRLICGHFAVDPGRWSFSRLCSDHECCLAGPTQLRAPGPVVHLSVSPPCFRFKEARRYRGKSRCGKPGQLLSNRLSGVTCRTCLKRWWLSTLVTR